MTKVNAHRKGIILAGGLGTRLKPLTTAISKQLLPIYDKPMIYYPLSTLMMAGIRDILIISAPNQLPAFRALFGDGGQLGLSLGYRGQENPDGIPQAFILGQEFLAGGPVVLILGDNIFYGNDLPELLRGVSAQTDRNTIFGYAVDNPREFGILTLDGEGKPVRIDEKPTEPASSWAIPGLYFYGNDVVDVAKGLEPSGRGELEISDLNQIYLERGELHVELLGRGTAWLDSGTADSLLDASEFVKIIEKRTGLKIACPEEIALAMGYIDREQFEKLCHGMAKSRYGDYLLKVLNSAT